MKRKAEICAHALALVTNDFASRTSIYRGARFQRHRVERAPGPFTVVAKIDLVALFLVAAGLEATGPKKGTR